MSKITAQLEAMDLAAIDPSERSEEEQMFIDIVTGQQTFLQFYDWTKVIREVGPVAVMFCSEQSITPT